MLGQEWDFLILKRILFRVPPNAIFYHDEILGIFQEYLKFYNHLFEKEQLGR